METPLIHSFLYRNSLFSCLFSHFEITYSILSIEYVNNEEGHYLSGIHVEIVPSEFIPNRIVDKIALYRNWFYCATQNVDIA